MDYIQKIKLLYSLQESKNYGFIEDEITDMEKNHKTKLPKILREYYLKLGKNENINYSFNRLLKPEEIRFTEDSNYFVFYEENQEAVRWAIKKNDMEKENPKVYGNYDPDSLMQDWFTDSETMDGFLLSMAYWNGVLGGLNYSANYSNETAVENDIIKIIENNWNEIKGITNQQLRFFTDKNIEIIVLTTDFENSVNGIYVGTNNEEEYKNILEKINIKWDYRDE
jgi:hypothetical protein